MRRWSSAAVAALAVIGGATFVASGAGASSPSALQIVTSTIAASKTVSSVHVVGSVTTGSQTINLNVRASNSGRGTGTLSINGATVKIVRVGSLVYFNADAAFWTQNAGASAAAFAGLWVSAPASSSNGKSFAEFLATSTLFDQILSGSKLSQSTFTMGPNTAIGSVAVYAITGTNKTSGSSGVIYIARSGKPYVVELDKTGTSGSGKLTFSAYNQPVHATAPKHAITIKQLEQKAEKAAAAG
jgi:hypothetical protein